MQGLCAIADGSATASGGNIGGAENGGRGGAGNTGVTGGASGNSGAGGISDTGGAGGTGGTAGTGGDDGGRGGGPGGAGGATGTGGDSGASGTGGAGAGGSDSGTGGAGGPGGAGGTRSTAIGGAAGTPPPPPPGKCDDTAVVGACPTPPGNPGCAEIFCGDRLWRNGVQSFNGLITYRIDDPQGQFSEAYKSAIRAIAQEWSNASEGVVGFRECPGCFGRIIVVVPGIGDGIVDPTQFEEVLPMPPSADSALPFHIIAHQWGHAIGLGHTYERADRDRYVRFDPAVWCGPDRSGLPPRCAFSPAPPGFPAIASDTFGVYDETSKMNRFAMDGICGAQQPDATSGTPTDGDGSAVDELYISHTLEMTPFRPIARSVSATEPLDYQLAPGVDPVGSPAITEWTPPVVEIFVRGTDRAIYRTHNDLVGTAFREWSSWEVAATDVDGDPAAVFADADTLHLAVHARADGSIRLRTRIKGTWSAWASLGAPAAGAASAPAIAARGSQSLDVFVRGNDGFLYTLNCTDPTTMCAASSSQPGAWSALPAPPRGTFIGNPNAAFLSNGSLMVPAVTNDGAAWLIGTDGIDFANSVWTPVLSATFAPGDPNPGVSIQTFANDIGLYSRDARGRLVVGSPGYLIYLLGGLITGPPGVTAALDGELWVHVAAIIDDHGHPGVWVRHSYGGGIQPPCNYNQPGTCAQCGCNLSGKPSCDL